MSREWENPQYQQDRRQKHGITIIFVAVGLILLIIALPKPKPRRSVSMANRLDQSQGDVSRDERRAPLSSDNSPSDSSTPKQGEERSSTPIPVPDLPPEATPPQESGKKSIDEIYQQAREQLKNGNTYQAYEIYKQLMSMDPRYGLELAQLMLKEGKVEAAIEVLEAVAAAVPNNFFAQKMLALAYYQHNDLTQCQEHLKAALALHSDSELLELQDQLSREVKIQDNYEDAEFTHFTVVYEGRELRSMWRMVRDILSDAYRSVGQQLDYFPSEKITVILYTEQDFVDVTQIPPGWVLGIFDGKIRIPVRGAEMQSWLLQHVVFHEFTHALIYTITRQCPRWLHEGLAEYCSGASRMALEKVIPLDQLDRALMSSDSEIVQLAYLESMMVVVSLIDRYRLYSVMELLQKMGSGTSFSQAFEDVFGISFGEFAARWGGGQ